MRKRNQDETGPPARAAGSGVGSQRSRAQAAREIRQAARSLRRVASGNDLRLIAYLLEMVALEAAETEARLATSEGET